MTIRPGGGLAGFRRVLWRRRRRDEQSKLGTRLDAELAKDSDQSRVHVDGTDAEAFGDLHVGPPLGDEASHPSLTQGEPGTISLHGDGSLLVTAWFGPEASGPLVTWR